MIPGEGDSLTFPVYHEGIGVSANHVAFQHREYGSALGTGAGWWEVDDNRLALPDRFAFCLPYVMQSPHLHFTPSQNTPGLCLLRPITLSCRKLSATSLTSQCEALCHGPLAHKMTRGGLL